MKKRNLFRIADALNKQCQTDVFIVVQNRETSRLFTHCTDEKFNLEIVTKLILDDLSLNERSENLKKFRTFKGLDYDQISQNIKSIEKMKA